MPSRVLIVLIVSLLADATVSAGPLRRVIGRPRVCRTVVVVQPMHAPREPDAATLRLKFDKAPTYYAESTTETTQTMTVMGQNVNQRQTQSYFLGWTPRGMTSEGNGVMEMEFHAVKMDIDIGGVKIADSPPAANPVATLLASVVGAKVQFHITPLGNIVSVVGAEELRRKLADSYPQMDPLVVSMFSRDSLKVLAAPFFAGLPEQPVRPGDTWLQLGKMPMGALGDFELESRFRYTGRAKDLDKIEVHRRLTFQPPKDRGRMPFDVKKVALSDGTGTGDILFDQARGRLVSADIQQNLAGTLIIEIGGMETPVVISQAQVFRIRTSDRPLLGK